VQVHPEIEETPDVTDIDSLETPFSSLEAERSPKIMSGADAPSFFPENPKDHINLPVFVNEKGSWSKMFFQSPLFLFCPGFPLQSFRASSELGPLENVLQNLDGVTRVAFPFRQESLEFHIEFAPSGLKRGSSLEFLMRGKGSIQKVFDFTRRVRKQEVEAHGEIDVNLAHQRFRRRIL